MKFEKREQIVEILEDLMCICLLWLLLGIIFFWWYDWRYRAEMEAEVGEPKQERLAEANHEANGTPWGETNGELQVILLNQEAQLERLREFQQQQAELLAEVQSNLRLVTQRLAASSVNQHQNTTTG